MANGQARTRKGGGDTRNDHEQDEGEGEEHRRREAKTDRRRENPDDTNSTAMNTMINYVTFKYKHKTRCGTNRALRMAARRTLEVAAGSYS